MTEGFQWMLAKLFLDRQTVGCVYSGNAYQDAAHLHTSRSVSYASNKVLKTHIAFD